MPSMNHFLSPNKNYWFPIWIFVASCDILQSDAAWAECAGAKNKLRMHVLCANPNSRRRSGCGRFNNTHTKQQQKVHVLRGAHMQSMWTPLERAWKFLSAWREYTSDECEWAAKYTALTCAHRYARIWHFVRQINILPAADASVVEIFMRRCSARRLWDFQLRGVKSLNDLELCLLILLFFFKYLVS